MRHILLSLLLSSCLGLQARAAQPEKPLGAGVMLGVPFGATGKYWFDETFAAQAAMGVSEGNLVVSGDYLMHFNEVLPKARKGRLPLYAGVGMKIKSEASTFFGLRFVGGISFFHSTQPIELFAEIAPVLRLAPREGGAFDGGAGLRYYF